METNQLLLSGRGHSRGSAVTAVGGVLGTKEDIVSDAQFLTFIPKARLSRSKANTEHTTTPH